MHYAVGIDLGTTNSCVAVYQNDQVRIVQNEAGARITPSVVTFTEDCVLTGKEAVKESHMYLKTTVYEAKRLIGQQFNNRKVQEDIQRFQYVIKNILNKPCIEIEYKDEEAQEYYPEEISAFILQRLKKVAEEAVNTNIVRAVVTVPAYFNDVQRQATKNAAYIAGFETVNVINEPTAAALAYNYKTKSNQEKCLLIFDFGGGTFDVTIVVVNGENCKVKATKGDSHLGGTDVDNNLARFIEDDIKKKLNVEINKINFCRLKRQCEKAKKNLSGKVLTSRVKIDHIGEENKTYHTSITRAKFEQLNEQIFNKTMQIVDQCLVDSQLTAQEIDEIILVGGSSRIPKIQELLIKKFDTQKINKQVNPDEAVAFGAAIYAHNLTEGKLVVEDVTSLSLGTNALGDYMSVIIPRNTPIPTKRLKTYGTIYNGQISMEFPIYQGESNVASENYELGKFTITDLTKAPAGNVQVRVCFNINEDGLIDICAKERGSHKTSNLTINVQKCGLSSEQIQKRIKQAVNNDQKVREVEEFLKHKNVLEKLIYQAMGIENTLYQGNKRNIKRKYKKKLNWLAQAKFQDVQKIIDRKNQTEKYINDNKLK